MSRQWIVIDTNIFCLTALSREDRLLEGNEAIDFLRRVVDHCETYGLAIDKEGLILEEYEKEIPRGSFGYFALRQMTDRIPGKTNFFEHKNPEWLGQMQNHESLDKHDRRFVATAFATPDKLLVSEDSVFHRNAALLKQQGLHLYGAEDANAEL